MGIFQQTARYYGKCKSCRARRAWERAHPGLDYDSRKVASTEAAARACTDCGLTKGIGEFVPIKQCKQGWYGRCRACRAKRARERYETDPFERELQKARVKRNRLRRRAQSGLGQTD
jgi:hypothetical protein